MSRAVELIWSEDYLAYDLGPQHPLKPVRVQLAVELARACGVLDGVPVVAPRPATPDELTSIHDPAYVEAVSRIAREAPEPFGAYGWGLGTGDNPVFDRMDESAGLLCGGAAVAAERVWSGAADHVWHPAAGAQHHAMPARASGFGIFNDTALAVRTLLERGARRVAYVDIDVHHGDGVQTIFYDDPRVLTISLHESGHYLFPGTGAVDEVGAGDAEGTSVNVPLAPFTGDDPWIAAFDRVVPPLVEAFAPDALVTQLGCDTHVTDPLAHLALTTRAYRHAAGAFHALAHERCGGRWIATGGGGYQVHAVVPRAWTIYAAEMAGAALPEELPASWTDRAREAGAAALPTRFDDPGVSLPPARAQEAAEEAERSATEVVARLFGYHGL